MMRKWMNLFEDVTTIQQQAAKLGVDLVLFEVDDRIDFHYIERTTGTSGAGAKAIDLLCDYADRVGKFILVQPDNARLGVYYANWGFVDFDDEYQDHYPDWDIDEVMIRYPERIAQVTPQQDIHA